MPANTIVIGIISVCRCILIANDTDYIRSRSIASSIIPSGQNRDLQVCAKCELATIKIFAFLISTLSYAAKIISSFLIISPYLAFLSHLFRVRSFFHVRWGCSYLLEPFRMLSYQWSRCKEFSGSFFSISFTIIHFQVLQRSCIYWTHCVF